MSSDPSYPEQPNQLPEEIEMDGFDTETLTEIVESVRIESPHGEMTLGDIMLDLTIAHKELSEYKQGALAQLQRLDERLQQAEAAGNDEVAEVIREVKKTCHGVHLRIERGDAELLGDRDGKYSGYFEREAEKGADAA